MITNRAAKATPTLAELEEIEEMVEKGECDLDEDDVEELRKTRDMEREVFD